MSSCEECGHEVKNYGIFSGGVRCRNYCNMRNQGGKREGAGRKPQKAGNARTVGKSIKVSQEVADYLTAVGTGIIEDALRKSKAFREWKAKSG